METLELHERKDNFSRFVVSTTSQTTHYHFKYTSDEFKEALEVNATSEKLIKLVNQGVLPYLRLQHWKDACSVGAPDNLEYTLGMLLDKGKHLLLYKLTAFLAPTCASAGCKFKSNSMQISTKVRQGSKNKNRSSFAY